MLGQFSTAVITFDGPHISYCITYQSGYYCYKTYRKSVQFCHKCGAIGQRQDICPRPREDFCYKCGQDVIAADHKCISNCKICGQPHETASKECKKQLRSNPPPYQAAYCTTSVSEASLGLFCNRPPRLAQGSAHSPPSASIMLMQHG